MRQQLAGAEGLGQIVVCSRLQALDTSVLAGAGREQDDRQCARLRVSPQRAEQSEPIQLWHHHVGEHQVRTAGTGGGRAAWPSATASTS